MYVIYALVDPRDRKVRYVGMTNDVYTRFQSHINGSGNFAKTSWIYGLRALNKMVIMETLEEIATQKEARERECYWIKHFESLEEPLLNIQKTSSPRRSRKNNAHLGRSVLVGCIESPIIVERPSCEDVIQHEQEVILPQKVTREIPLRIKPDYDYEQAIKVWNAGYQSAREFAKAISFYGVHVGKDTALKIIKEMRRKQLI